MFFFEKQHQAMLYLKGNLSDTLPVVLLAICPPKNNLFFA
jgi:hypothetical protein